MHPSVAWFEGGVNVVCFWLFVWLGFFFSPYMRMCVLKSCLQTSVFAEAAFTWMKDCLLVCCGWCRSNLTVTTAKFIGCTVIRRRPMKVQAVQCSSLLYGHPCGQEEKEREGCWCGSARCFCKCLSIFSPILPWIPILQDYSSCYKKLI